MYAGALSTSTIITLGTILLVVCILGVARKTVSSVMSALGICLLVVFIIQATSEVVLIDFSQLADFVIYWALRLFRWAQDTFWPSLTDAAREIENAM